MIVREKSESKETFAAFKPLCIIYDHLFSIGERTDEQDGAWEGNAVIYIMSFAKQNDRNAE